MQLNTDRMTLERHTLDRLAFAPPAPPGLVRALALAVLAHAVLLAGLSVSVRWKRELPPASFSAELWASLPREAAPQPAAALPPPEPDAAVPRAPEKAIPTPLAPAPAPSPALSNADIAVQRETLAKRQQLQARAELALRDQEQAARVAKERATQAEVAKRQAALDAQKQAAELARQKSSQTTAQAKLEAQRLDSQRQENLKRMAALAGANTTGATALINSGSNSGTGGSGSAAKTAGPSASYGGKIQERIRPKIVFADELAGNPVAEVEVRAAPDGTITGRTLKTSSGNKAWDDAVLKAIDKTDTLPRDVDGRVPPVLVIGFRPKT